MCLDYETYSPKFVLECSNGSQLYNIWGLTKCKSPFLCKPGYEGNFCDECMPFHYPITGVNKIVDADTGEGVNCRSKLIWNTLYEV